MALNTPTLIARQAIQVLARQLVLGVTVYTDASADFQGQVGSTINIRKIGSLTARAQVNGGDAITVDAAADTVVPLTLAHQLYSAVRITDQDLTMAIEDLAQQILTPQILAVVTLVESDIYSVLNAVTGGIVNVTAANIRNSVLTAGATLDNAYVPYAERVLAVSPNVAQLILQDTSQTLQALVQGGDPSAFRDAIIGEYLGFTVVKAPGLAATEARAYHRDAVAFASRAPLVPDGVPFGKGISFGGYALRWIRDYDASTLSDRSVVSCLSGATLLDGTRMVRLTTLAA